MQRSFFSLFLGLLFLCSIIVFGSIQTMLIIDPGVPPPTPENFSIELLTDDTVFLSWSNQTFVYTWRIYILDEFNGTFNKSSAVNISGITALNFTDSSATSVPVRYYILATVGPVGRETLGEDVLGVCTIHFNSDKNKTANMIGLCINTTILASDIVRKLPGNSSITRLHRGYPPLERYVTYNQTSPPDFTLLPGVGYKVNALEPASLSMVGRAFIHMNLSLISYYDPFLKYHVGRNWISVPHNGYSASSFLSLLPEESIITQLNRSNASVELWQPHHGDSGEYHDFDLVPGRGYVVYVEDDVNILVD